MNIRQQVPLAPFTTFKLGGRAQYFFAAKTQSELIAALEWATKKDIPFTILGGGSNMLIPDEGFPGLVIKNETKGISYKERDPEVVLVTARSGEDWDEFVKDTISRSLYGLENLSGIPGSVGATPIQNVGAYGVDVKDRIASVKVYDSLSHKERILQNEECKFKYRDSIFKHEEGRKYLILEVTFKLSKKEGYVTHYRDVDEYLKEHNVAPSLEHIREAILTIRKSKFPDLTTHGSAGSYFKNPIITSDQLNVLQEMYPGIPHFVDDEQNVKISLAWVLEHVCSVKGLRVGNVGTFHKQPLVVVHYGGGTTKEIKKFAEELQKKVFLYTKIKIVPEVTFL